MVFFTPVLLIEWRIGHDEVCLERLVLVVMESVGFLLTEICRDASNGEVHLCKLVCGLGVFLAVNGDIFLVAVVALNEFETLYEHTARTTARVINLALERLNHFGDEVDDALRSIEFSFTLTLGDCEFAEEVFVNSADKVVLFILEGVNLVNLIKK